MEVSVRGALSRLVVAAAMTAVLSASVGVVLVPAAAAAGRDAMTRRNDRSADELAQDLVGRFLDLFVGEPDVAGLGEFLSPAFLRQGADGTSYTKSEYLESTPAVIASYEVLDLEATRSGSILVARATKWSPTRSSEAARRRPSPPRASRCS